MADINRQITHLSDEKRVAIPTDEAAFHLNLAVSTLYSWSSDGGKIEPIRLTGNRLLWRVSDIKKLLGMEG